MPADRAPHLLEACAGAAAVSLAAFGGAPPAKYRGGKRRYATAILEALGLEPGAGSQTDLRVTLTEPGLWGRAWSLLASGLRDAAARALGAMRLEGRPLFDQLARSTPPADPVEWLASFVALQASSALGKEVSIAQDGRWRTAGYAALSPSAVRKGFREALVPGQLAKRVASIPQQFLDVLVARHERAHLEVDTEPPTHVLIDPPYRGTAGYQHKLERAEVVELAKGWAARGATVAVCEHEPIPELLADGWRAVQLSGQQVAFGPRTASVRVSEWLTLSRGGRR